MRVHLGTSLFEPPIQNATLISFFSQALDGRHRIETNLELPPASAWLAQQSRDLQDEVRLAIDTSLELEAREPALTRVRVDRFVRSDFDSDPLQIRFEDATAFLESPVSLLLEDQNTDYSFLLSMLTPEERRMFETLVRRGYLRVEHGGGLGSMQNRIVARTNDPAARHRLWVFFDSDALRPKTPSAQSEALRTACGDIPHYQLSRRQIESYIPRPALSAWASTRIGRAAQRRRWALLGAFLRMRDPQRYHFNMKTGFAGDAKRVDSNAGDLYDDVTTVDKRSLENGFGSQLATLFQTGQVKEQDLRRDSGWTELRPVIQDLVAFLR